MFYEIEKQEQRFETALQRYLAWTEGKISLDGEIIGYWEADPASIRDQIWVAHGCFWGGQYDLGNAIISKVEFKKSHFSPMIATQILVKFSDRLNSENQERLRNYLQDSVDFICQDENSFLGVNDNFPCMATYIAIIAGELLNNAMLHQRGVTYLKQFVKLLRRRTVSSEHTSPTYTAIQLMAMAEIYEHTHNPEVKEDALFCETRLWNDILGHYHPKLEKMAGPYSRAYTVDSTAQVHSSDFLLYSLLGEKISIDPMAFLLSDEVKVIHGNSIWFMLVQLIWISAARYHCPADLVQSALERKFPYAFEVDCEYSSSRDDFPVGTQEYSYGCKIGWNRTYMMSQYALGVGENCFHNGSQTDLFHFMYKKKNGKLGCLYPRYIINGEKPDVRGMLWDRGQKIGLSHQNIAIVAYKPMGCLKSAEMTEAKLSIIMPSFYGEPETMIIKDNAVYIKDHDVYFSIFSFSKAVVIERVPNFILFTIENDLSNDLNEMANGFAFAASTEYEAGSFENFMNTEFELEDKVIVSPHSRGTHLRNMFFKWGENSLEMEFDIEAHGIKYQLINDQLPIKRSGIR